MDQQAVIAEKGLLQGVKAVQLAPSAINRHPARLAYKSGTVSAYVEHTNGSNPVDLGIAKANFEIAASGRFELGNHGRFLKA